MEAKTHRKIKSGTEYDALFPPASLKDKTVKKGATVSDTVKFIPKVVQDTLPQTKKIARILRDENLRKTCRNIWEFVYNHIRYEKDEEGKEQIRSPARSWHDRAKGVDCDCYTVFISSILTNLKIPHRLRIAKYRKDYFQHIYPVVPDEGGYITIDCVVDEFDHEEPYTEIKDTKMDLEYLSGTEQESQDVGALFKRKKPVVSTTPKKKGFFKKVVGKALHVVNRANPATVLLRNGILASMKLNLMQVAQRIKYTYLSDEEAKKRGIDMGKLTQLRKIRERLEKIFYGAGGKQENLRKAILGGKGNKKHDVAGLGNYGEEFSGTENSAASIAELLGEQMFFSENEETLGSLGEPVLAASIASSSGAMAIIAELIKKVGNIFPKKDSGDSKDYDAAEKDADTKNMPAEIENNKQDIAKMDAEAAPEARETGASLPVPAAAQDDNSAGADKDDPSKENFWDKNKTWLKPTLWGAGGLAVLAGAFKMFKGSKPGKPQSGLSGKPRKRHGGGKKGPVALM